MKKILFIFLSFLILSCQYNPGAEGGPVKEHEAPALNQIVKPIEYGNGVYYFNCTERQFAVSLADFLSDTTKSVQTMTGDGSSGYGSDAGYFVVIKNKNQ